MKTKELLAFACVLYLVGCQPTDTNRIQTESKLYPVRFSLQLKKEVLPFPTSRSIPELTVPDPGIVKEPPVTPDELYNKIEYVVYKADDPAVYIHHRQYKPSDEDFGIIYDTLPAGNYKMAFIAHSSGTANLAGNLLSFDKVSDTFHATKTLLMEEGKSIDNEIEMKRIVSRIEFTSDETVPSTLKRFDMEIVPYFSQTDIFTGQGTAQAGTFTVSHLFTDEEKGKAAPVHSFYTFIPSTSETISTTITATDNDESVIQRWEVKGISPIINKIIRYKGKIYSPANPDATFSISIFGDGAWDEPGEAIPLQ